MTGLLGCARDTRSRAVAVAGAGSAHGGQAGCVSRPGLVVAPLGETEQNTSRRVHETRPHHVVLFTAYAHVSVCGCGWIKLIVHACMPHPSNPIARTLRCPQSTVRCKQHDAEPRPLVLRACTYGWLIYACMRAHTAGRVCVHACVATAAPSLSRQQAGLGGTALHVRQRHTTRGPFSAHRIQNARNLCISPDAEAAARVQHAFRPA